MIAVSRLSIPDVLEIAPERHGDDRGFFSEVWSEAAFHAAGLTMAFVQDNHSHSAAAGVLRGLHYQVPPFAQGKLVRVVRGSVFDVAVDIRQGSPTYGSWASLIVSAKAWNQIYVPPGFAHGFVTLEPDREVLYKTTAPYSKEHDRAIRYDDPDIAIDWPVRGSDIILSERDRAAPSLRDAEGAIHHGDER